MTVGQAGGLTGVDTGTADITLAAGFKRVAGDGTGGQIKVAPNLTAPLLSSTGQIRLYTGNSNDTGNLGQLDATLTDLYLWSLNGNPVNAQTFTAFSPGASITNGARAQVMFREKIALAPGLKNMTYTYGEVDKSINVYDVLKANNTGVMNQSTSAGKFVYDSTKFFEQTQGASIQNTKWSSSDRLNANQAGYSISIDGSQSGAFDLSKASALIMVNPKALTVSYSAENKVYDGDTTATVAPRTTDTLTNDVVAFTQTSAFENPEIGRNKTVNVTGITLSGVDASNYTLINPTYVTKANITSTKTDPDPTESGTSGGGSGTGGGTSTTETSSSSSNTSQTSTTASTSTTSTTTSSSTSEPAVKPDANNLIEPKGTNVAGSNASNVSVQVAEFEFKLSAAEDENACSIDNLENCVCEAPEDDKGNPMEWMEICYPEEEKKA